MCMSVPQIAVLPTLISTSLGPTLGSGMSCIQMPGSAFALTSAFMLGISSGAFRASIGGCVGQSVSVDDAEIAADGDEPFDGPVQLLERVTRGHLRADAGLAHGD